MHKVRKIPPSTSRKYNKIRQAASPVKLISNKIQREPKQGLHFSQTSLLRNFLFMSIQMLSNAFRHELTILPFTILSLTSWTGESSHRHLVHE